MPTPLDIITNALYELNVMAPGEALSSEDSDFGLSKLNRLIDQWSAQRRFAWNVNFSNWTLTPGKQPHTIGPSGDFVAPRPVRIENAALVISGAQNVTLPLTIRDDDWWANQRVKQVQSAVPTDLYVSPDVPNFSLYLWPVPNTAYGLELETWVNLTGNQAIDSQLVLAPGYEEALTLTLAEGLAGPFGVTSSNPTLVGYIAQKAREARSVIKNNNSPSPRMNLRDCGLQNEKAPKGNYLTGWIR